MSPDGRLDLESSFKVGDYEPDVADFEADWLVQIALHDPARVLRRVEAGRRLVDEIASWRHRVVDDCWYTCPAATEARDGGETCNENKADGRCLCGLERRQVATLKALILEFVDYPDYREGWRP